MPEESVFDLRLICNALQELTDLNLDLQEMNIDMYKAYNKMNFWISVRDKKKNSSVFCYRMLKLLYSRLSFHI